MKLICLIVFLLLVRYSYTQTGTLTDSRDGKIYKTVVIGTQTWMAENLNVSIFRNGDVIKGAFTYQQWRKNGESEIPAWCYYENDSINNKKYAKLYNWYAVNDKRGLAPEGWHIPSQEEWDLLINFLGGEDIAGERMKSIDGWNVEGNGTNVSNFSAYPGGRCNFGGGFDATMGSVGCWWSTTEYEAPYSALYKYLSCNYGGVFSGNNLRGSGMSIRCVKD